MNGLQFYLALSLGSTVFAVSIWLLTYAPGLRQRP